MGQKLDFVYNIDGTDGCLAPLLQDCDFPRYLKDHGENEYGLL